MPYLVAAQDRHLAFGFWPVARSKWLSAKYLNDVADHTIKRGFWQGWLTAFRFSGKKHCWLILAQRNHKGGALQTVSPSNSEKLRAFEASYRKPRILPGDHSNEIRIVFRAYGPFDASLLDGTNAELAVSVNGSDVLIPGTLHEARSASAPGTMHTFDFRPNWLEDLRPIRFRGDNHYSNVRSIRLDLGGCTRSATNPFFEQPS